MKKILTEIGLLVLILALYLQFPAIRFPIVIGVIFLAIWVIPFQLFLSVSFQNWINELSGRYHSLSFEKRINQIRATFESLSVVESKKLRWFYVHVCLFHYFMILLMGFGFILLTSFFLVGGIGNKDVLLSAASLSGAIIVTAFGVFIIPRMYPKQTRTNLDETIHLFTRKDWRKRLFTPENNSDEAFSIEGTAKKTFYDFWLQGKTSAEKKAAFLNFIEKINKTSRNGILFTVNDEGKIVIKRVLDQRSVSKSLAGFLKYAIEDEKVLDKLVLHHKCRELLRATFDIDVKGLDFVQNEKLNNLSVDYVDVYRPAN